MGRNLGDGGADSNSGADRDVGMDGILNDNEVDNIGGRIIDTGIDTDLTLNDDASNVGGGNGSLASAGESVSPPPDRTLIEDELWNDRIQDPGVAHEELQSTSYLRNKIVSVGDNDDRRFYYHLTTIAVDFARKY